MLEDRDYMRGPDLYRRRISFTVLLIIVNAAVFVLQLIASHSMQAWVIEGKYFKLSLDGIEHLYLWQLVTFQFMHGGFIHILFNSLVIYFFGRPVETALGGPRFLTLYFFSGVIGGLVQVLFAFLFPSFDGPVVGASAGAAGLVAAFAVIHWTQPFTLLFYFIPITMRGRTLLWASIGLAIIGILTPNSGVANAAHLGGILTGYLYMRHLVNRNWFSFLQMPWKSRGRPPKKPDMDVSAEEFLRREVDPILEKISAHGIQSLTAQERKILEKARSKMDKR